VLSFLGGGGDFLYFNKASRHRSHYAQPGLKHNNAKTDHVSTRQTKRQNLWICIATNIKEYS